MSNANEHMPEQGRQCMRIAALLLYSVCAYVVPLQAASLTVSVTDAAEAPLNDAVVYATALPRATAARPSRGAMVAQSNKMFVPNVTVVQTGTAVSFPNKDEIRHHVYSFSPAKIFDLKLYSGVPAAPIVFDKPGTVILGCNIHDSMLGYIYIVDTPHFGKTENGAARIEGLAAGDYEVRAWHPQFRGDPPMQRIKVGAADGAAKFSLRLAPVQSQARQAAPAIY